MSNAKQIATLLLDLKCVALNAKQPFQYTSGMLSPIYCDNRLIMSYPDRRQQVIDAFLKLIQEKAINFDVVAGVATAGITHAAWIADRLNKPMVYVRDKAKGHGKQNQIEGVINKGQTALVVEDLISTGGSATAAAFALRDAGATVNHCIAIFSYQLPTAIQAFTDCQVQLNTLSDFSTLVNVATEQGAIDNADKNTILAWNKNPNEWGKQMGFE